MAAKKYKKDEVSYAEDELGLYYRVQMRCKYESKSGFYKKAALEKLEREDNPSMFTQSLAQPSIPLKNDNYLPINQDGLNNMLDSFMEWCNEEWYQR